MGGWAMKSYCVIGWSLIVMHIVGAAVLAPADWGMAAGALFGAVYLSFIWLVSGLYVAHILHMGIAHRAIEFKPWFIDTISVTNGFAGIYVDPRAWVNRHRHHHAFSDKTGDPSKTGSDGFWKTLYLCFSPRPCKPDLATDAVFERPALRLVCHPIFPWFSQLSSLGLLWLAVLDFVFALALWAGVRLVAIWVNMIQNFWAHDRRYGKRPYADEPDNSVNITEALPVMATFSACLQNNHHRHARFARMSHEANQFDFGWISLRWMQAMGLARVLPEGAAVPPGAALADIGA
jgi:fatty-acid desaturase